MTIGLRPRWLPLRSVIAHRKSVSAIDDLTKYKRCRVQLYGQGIVLRDIVAGAEIKTKSQQVCRAGDFLVAEIDAKVGGFGVVPPELDGAIVSSHYFLFDIDREELDATYLEWFIRSSYFQDQVLAQGSTNYAAIRPEDVLEYRIALPSLVEQRKMAMRLNEIGARLGGISELSRQTRDEARAVLASERARVFAEAVAYGTTRLDRWVTLERGKFSHRPRNEPRFFGGEHPWIQIREIESSGKYIATWRDSLNDMGLAISKKFPKGTILVSIAATIGAVGILEFDCCVPDSVVGITPGSETTAEYVYHYLSYVRSHLEQVAPQSAQKNINLEILSALPIPTLTLEQQRRVADRLNKLEVAIHTVRQLQDRRQSEIEATLRSVLATTFRPDRAGSAEAVTPSGGGELRRKS